MEISRIDEQLKQDKPYTALLYCPPGIGKSTAIGLAAEASEWKTLVLDIDRTIDRTIAKREIVKDSSRLYTAKIDNINTFEDWTNTLNTLSQMKESGTLEFSTIAVDNISELERCILSDLGRQGKNKGVPAQSDYQYMQFKLVNSLRYMKALDVNIIWTAWEDVRQIVSPNGTSYSQIIPKMSHKIVDNICGLCDVVGKILVNTEGQHGILLEATQNIYAKNQIDSRKTCKVEDFVKFEKGETE